jgi:hypothetical protein
MRGREVVPKAAIRHLPARSMHRFTIYIDLSRLTAGREFRLSVFCLYSTSVVSDLF